MIDVWLTKIEQHVNVNDRLTFTLLDPWTCGARFSKLREIIYGK